MARINDLFKETTALVPEIIEGLKTIIRFDNVGAFDLVDDYVHRNWFVGDAEASMTEQWQEEKSNILLESQVNALPEEFVNWVRDNFSAGEFAQWINQGASFNADRNAQRIVNDLQTAVDQAPGLYGRTERATIETSEGKQQFVDEGQLTTPGTLATPEAQIEWLKNIEQGLGRDLDTSELDSKNRQQWITWTPTPFGVPDTTTQPGEQDMPGPNVQPPPSRTVTTDAGFVGDDPTALTAPRATGDTTDQTSSGGGDQYESEYDLGLLSETIGNIDFFTGPDWIINPGDMPRGMPDIEGPMNVIDYMNKFEISPNRAKEILRKTAGWSKYTEWDANWAAMTPEEQDRAVANTEHQVWIQAQLYGIDIPKDHPIIREIATKIKRMGWEGATDERVREIFYNHKEFLVNRAVGQHAATVDDVKSRAANWMISLSKDQRDEYAKQIALGTATLDTVEAAFKDMAYKNYPSLRGVIDSGMNLADYSDPYAVEIGSLLDREINFNGHDKEMFNEIFMGAVDDDGVIRPKTFNEAKTYVKKTPKYGWDKTPDARKQYRSVGEVLLQKFGAVA